MWQPEKVIRRSMLSKANMNGALQRFVLGEMIKTSRLDIDALAVFIRKNQIEPDWMSMQLPIGTRT